MGVEENYDVSSSPTYLNNVFVEAVQKTSFEQLPVAPRKSNKPWVTTEAFALIDQRVYARQCRDYEEERKLTVLLKRQIQMDKSTWLKGLAGSGSWEDIKSYDIHEDHLKEDYKTPQVCWSIQTRGRIHWHFTYKMSSGRSDHAPW